MQWDDVTWDAVGNQSQGTDTEPWPFISRSFGVGETQRERLNPGIPILSPWESAGQSFSPSLKIQLYLVEALFGWNFCSLWRLSPAEAMKLITHQTRVSPYRVILGRCWTGPDPNTDQGKPPIPPLPPIPHLCDWFSMDFPTGVWRMEALVEQAVSTEPAPGLAPALPRRTREHNLNQTLRKSRYPSPLNATCTKSMEPAAVWPQHSH